MIASITMKKALTVSELRDPVHGFVRFDSDEVKVINSPEFQRLRNIHQLALTYYVYPGATHKRFEHCLGVMETASRIYDVVTDDRHVLSDSEIKSIVPKVGEFDWNYEEGPKDGGPLPRLGPSALSCGGEFTPPRHLARKIQLFHNHWTRNGKGMEKEAQGPTLRCSKNRSRSETLLRTNSQVESILSEMIIGDTFGADRIDYFCGTRTMRSSGRKV